MSYNKINSASKNTLAKDAADKKRMTRRMRNLKLMRKQNEKAQTKS